MCRSDVVASAERVSTCRGSSVCCELARAVFSVSLLISCCRDDRQEDTHRLLERRQGQAIRRTARLESCHTNVVYEALYNAFGGCVQKIKNLDWTFYWDWFKWPFNNWGQHPLRHYKKNIASGNKKVYHTWKSLTPTLATRLPTTLLDFETFVYPAKVLDQSSTPPPPQVKSKRNNNTSVVTRKLEEF